MGTVGVARDEKSTRGGSWVYTNRNLGLKMEILVETKDSYMTHEYGVKYWLLTEEHKRIALLYLAAITFFFFLGGIFATIIRLELLTPLGDLVSAQTYNKLFTLHGVIMIFLFLIPSIPATLGNFLVPLMIGCKDLAFPKLNLLSWYVLMAGGAPAAFAMLCGW